MPQGVEHFALFAVARVWDCLPKPVMPQGVEHLFAIQNMVFSVLLPKPVMPQGVEHQQSQTYEAWLETAQTSDAARR